MFEISFLSRCGDKRRMEGYGLSKKRRVTRNVNSMKHEITKEQHNLRGFSGKIG